MSLAQHVSAVEGSDRVDLASLYDVPDNAGLQLGSQLVRRLNLTLSYDPPPKGEAPAEKLDPVGCIQVFHFQANSMGANAATGFGDDTTPAVMPYGSLRLKNCRQVLRAGLRTVAERDEPEDPEPLEVRHRQRRMKQDLGPSAMRSEEAQVSTSETASGTEADNDAADGEDEDANEDEDLEASQISLGHGREADGT